MKKVHVLFSLLFSMLIIKETDAADTTVVSSPDGANRFLLYPANNALHFKVTRNGAEIVKHSPLIVTIDGKVVTEKVKIGKAVTSKSNSTYPVLGAHSTARDNYNAAALTIQ